MPVRGSGTWRLCRDCSPESFPACGRCGARPANIRRHLAEPICPPCYRAIRTTPRFCAACQTRRLLPYRIDGKDLCADCAGKPRLFACVVCGSDSDPLPGQRCPTCLHIARVDRFLTGLDGRIDPRLVPLRDYLVGACTRPATTRRWLSQSASARIVRAMVTGDLELRLETLARLPQTPATGYAAALLQTAGVVPAANYERIRLEAWQAEALTRITDPRARRIAKQYANWILNPRFTTPGTRETVDEWQRHHGSKQTLTAVIDLLETITTSGHTLATWPQREHDRYIAAKPVGQRLVGFVSWARAQRLTTLKMTNTSARTRRPTLAQEQRSAIARRLLRDQTLASSTRLVGLLTVIYGIPVTRIVTLKSDQITESGQHLAITLGTDPLTLPDPIAYIVREHLATNSSTFANPEWLFPGRRPGDHLSARVARTQLTRAGIETRAAQTSALLDIARHTPRSVTADLLGISIRHASELADDAGRDWATYPSLTSARD